MKLLSTIALTIFTSALSFGQTLKDAIHKTDNERYTDAFNEFNSLVAKEPNNGENYFYFGDYYLLKGELDSAKLMWNKGYAVDQLSPMSVVGNGRVLWLKGDQAAAKAEFLKAQTLTKKNKIKNAEVNRGIAKIYIEAPTKNLDEAILLLNDAILKDPYNEDNYLLLGDALLEKTPDNGSAAIKNYNKVLEINPKSPRGIVRVAKLYQRARNYELANEKYKEAKGVDSTYAPAFRENAELNMQFKQATKAIENWKRYLELNNTTEARYRYATSMFIGKQYCEAITEINNLKQRGFSNFYTERMLAYSYLECTTETDAFKKGIEASDKFFAIAPKEKITYLDYKNKGALYSKSGSDSLAIVEYENASKLSEVAAKDLAGDLAKLYSKAKKYDKAIEAYNFKATLNKLSPAEEYDLGKCYYFGPKSYSLADSAFARVAKLSPNYAPAYLWRARSSFQLDPKNEKWLCQPFYEKVIEIVKVEDRGTPSNKAMVMESAKYLGDYYVRSEAKDLVKAKTFWEIVIALDPADAQAKAFLGLK